MPYEGWPEKNSWQIVSASYVEKRIDKVKARSRCSQERSRLSESQESTTKLLRSRKCQRRKSTEEMWFPVKRVREGERLNLIKDLELSFMLVDSRENIYPKTP
jgi:hypothetical protein